MKNMLASIWRPVKGVFIKDLGPNFFLFQFFHELDMARIQSNGPWTFDNLLLITKRLHIGEQPARVPLFHVELWVQVYDLPFGFMTEKVGKSIGNFIGLFVDSDQHNFMGVWQNYMRIRVAFDVRMPLKRRMKLKNSGGEWVWIHFKYEKLPTFCFYCGFLGHSDKFCAKLFNSPSAPSDRVYGSWLRAPTRKQQSQVGGKWLRSSFPGNSSEQHDGGLDDASGGYSPEDSTVNVVPNFTEGGFLDKDQFEGGNRQQRMVVSSLVDEKSKADFQNTDLSIIDPLNDISNSLVTAKGNEVLISDNKRRRLDDKIVETTSSSGYIAISDNESPSDKNQKNLLAVGPGPQAHRDQ
ncbi:hypothetical protein DH2020_000978 [Rehmannia glutinosa]|uniref:CCHC-type domain-containing protein n=1 Tax=Rehmannia glutinosa TaxID=99300 RepID=A0ABR0XYM8_REHGL